MFPEYDLSAFKAMTVETPSRRFRREYHEATSASKPSGKQDPVTVRFNVETYRALMLARIARFFSVA